MPATPITDIAFHKREDDLVVATQGRSFYVLGDMPMVRQLATVTPDIKLFQPKDTYRISCGFGRGIGVARSSFQASIKFASPPMGRRKRKSSQ